MPRIELILLWHARLGCVNDGHTYNAAQRPADDKVIKELCYNGYWVFQDLVYNPEHSGCLPRAFCSAVPLKPQCALLTTLKVIQVDTSMHNSSHNATVCP